VRAVIRQKISQAPAEIKHGGSRPRLSARTRRENRLLNDRLRFDQGGQFWTRGDRLGRVEAEIEPRSLIPSTWPAFEYAVRKWGIGALPAYADLD